MIVIYKDTVKDIKVKFGDLDKGVAFCRYGDLYLKTNETTIGTNAINLRSGSLCSLKCDDEVSFVLAEVVWSLVMDKP